MSSLDASFVLVDDNKPAFLTEPTRELIHPSQNDSYSPGGHGTHAHDWSLGATGGGITIHGRHFVDAYGRVCQLRGVNVAGSCKSYVYVNGFVLLKRAMFMVCAG